MMRERLTNGPEALSRAPCAWVDGPGPLHRVTDKRDPPVGTNYKTSGKMENVLFTGPPSQRRWLALRSVRNVIAELENLKMNYLHTVKYV